MNIYNLNRLMAINKINTNACVMKLTNRIDQLLNMI